MIKYIQMRFLCSLGCICIRSRFILSVSKQQENNIQARYYEIHGGCIQSTNVGRYISLISMVPSFMLFKPESWTRGMRTTHHVIQFGLPYDVTTFLQFLQIHKTLKKANRRSSCSLKAKKNILLMTRIGIYFINLL